MFYKVEAKVETEIPVEQKQIDKLYSRRERLLELALDNNDDSHKLHNILVVVRQVSKEITLLEKSMRGVLI